MPTKLPFKVSPKVETVECGNERTGILEFPVLGDITVREQAFVNDHLATNSTFLEIARISNKIAKSQRIDPLAAHRFLTRVISESLGQSDKKFSDKEQGWKIKYAREIEELSAFLLRNQWERQTVTAAALIRFRIEGMEEFSIDDARDLAANLVQEIFAFAVLEQTGDREMLSDEEMDKELEEKLGK